MLRVQCVVVKTAKDSRQATKVVNSLDTQTAAFLVTSGDRWLRSFVSPLEGDGNEKGKPRR